MALVTPVKPAQTTVATPTLTPMQPMYYPPNRVLLFGMGGSGKTTALVSILKNPTLKLRVLGIDGNCIAALTYALRKERITLAPSQLIVSQFRLSPAERAALVKSFTSTSAAIPGNKAKTSGKDWVWKQMVTFTGTDLATGEPVDCGGIDTFDPDTVLVLDSWTAIQSHLVRAHITSATGADRSTYLEVQDTTIDFMGKLLASIECHLIVMAHAKVTDKQKGIRGAVVVPDIYGQAGIQTFAGLFSDVIHTRKEGEKATWVCLENGVMATIRNIPLSLYPDLKPNACPPDFLDPRYTFFKPMK